MRTFLLSSAALLGAGIAVGVLPNAARAEDGIRLEVSGDYKAVFQGTIDDDEEGEPGNDRNTVGFFQDSDIVFSGSTLLDNGLEVGAVVEITGEDDDDQIGEAWIWFGGGFGEVRMGSHDDALESLCVTPPGGTQNFSAFSPDQWGANTFTTNAVCESADDEGSAQRLLYVSPVFGGFQFGLSYVPSSDKKTHDQGVGPHIGMPINEDETSRHNVALYGLYTYEADDWHILLGAGTSLEGHVEKTNGGPNRAESDFYQAGVVLGFGAFEVGAAFEYYNDDDAFLPTLTNGDIVADRWVAGVGAAYSMDAWTFGVGYSMLDTDIRIRGAPDEAFTQQRTALTAIYHLGPGIDLDGELAYTWTDADPESAENFADFADYDAFEFGTGIFIEF